MTFVAGMICGSILCLGVQGVLAYRRWCSTLRGAQEETDRWCDEHAKEA